MSHEIQIINKEIEIFIKGPNSVSSSPVLRSALAWSHFKKTTTLGCLGGAAG